MNKGQWHLMIIHFSTVKHLLRTKSEHMIGTNTQARNTGTINLLLSMVLLICGKSPLKSYDMLCLCSKVTLWAEAMLDRGYTTLNIVLSIIKRIGNINSTIAMNNMRNTNREFNNLQLLSV